MHVHADLYLPYVQEQETSCLLFCLSLIHFFLLLIPRSLFIAKTQAYYFNTLPDVCGPPESVRTANVKTLVKIEWLLVFISPSHFQKEINK